MNKLKNTVKRIATLGLAALLLTNSFPATAFADEIDGTEPAIVMDKELPESSEEVIAGESGEGVSETDGLSGVLMRSVRQSVPEKRPLEVSPLYTVEFTCHDMQYIMPGDSSTALSEILDNVGLAGEVSDVEVSDESLFSAMKCEMSEDGKAPKQDENGGLIKSEDGEWVITAHQAFSSTEWMKVTIGGVVHEIIVTDTESVKYIDENGVEQTCTEYTVLTGTETTLSEGWYVVNSTINYTSKITGSGNVHIILADGGKMNIGSEQSPIEDYGLDCFTTNYSSTLTIYGQANGTGELNSFVDKYTRYAIFSSNITINGGKIKAISKKATAILSNNEFNYNGGQVYASGDGQGIYGLYKITLNWKKDTDFIHANSYYNPYNGIAIAEGKTFTDGSKYYIAENASEIAALIDTKLSASATSAHGVTFNSNGGSAVATQILTAGGKATKPSDPSRDGCNFGGWYEDEKLTKEYSFDNAVNKSFTLYRRNRWLIAGKGIYYFICGWMGIFLQCSSKE